MRFVWDNFKIDAALVRGEKATRDYPGSEPDIQILEAWRLAHDLSWVKLSPRAVELLDEAYHEELLSAAMEKSFENARDAEDQHWEAKVSEAAGK